MIIPAALVVVHGGILLVREDMLVVSCAYAAQTRRMCVFT
jgi:hypothetical protein